MSEDVPAPPTFVKVGSLRPDALGLNLIVKVGVRSGRRWQRGFGTPLAAIATAQVILLHPCSEPPPSAATSPHPLQVVEAKVVTEKAERVGRQPVKVTEALLGDETGVVVATIRREQGARVLRRQGTPAPSLPPATATAACIALDPGRRCLQPGAQLWQHAAHAVDVCPPPPPLAQTSSSLALSSCYSMPRWTCFAGVRGRALAWRAAWGRGACSCQCLPTSVIKGKMGRGARL